MLRILTIIILLCSLTGNGIAQMQLSGPTCVKTGTTYQYNIYGKWQSGDNAKLCITGGEFVNGSTNCEFDSVISFIRVKWYDDFQDGSLVLSSNSGNASIAVNISTALTPGTITSGHKQDLPYETIPQTIVCSNPQGGSCNPSYALQWEKSADGNNWVSIENATQKNLDFNFPLTKTAYFRRKLNENNSSEIAYSDTAVVYIGADLKAHQ